MKKLSLAFLFVFAISTIGQLMAPTLSANEYISTTPNLDKVTEASINNPDLKYKDIIAEGTIDEKELADELSTFDISLEEFKASIGPQKQRFVCGGICASIAIGVGIPVALHILKTASEIGRNATCQKHEHKKGWDTYCDAVPGYRDYGLNGKTF
jgi:hypothetical protein